MSRYKRPERIITGESRRCDDCGTWPAPCQWDKATRLCEPCRDTRKTGTEGVSSVQR